MSTTQEDAQVNRIVRITYCNPAYEFVFAIDSGYCTNADMNIQAEDVPWYIAAVVVAGPDQHVQVIEFPATWKPLPKIAKRFLSYEAALAACGSFAERYREE